MDRLSVRQRLGLLSVEVYFLFVTRTTLFYTLPLFRSYLIHFVNQHIDQGIRAVRCDLVNCLLVDAPVCLLLSQY